MRVVKKFQNPSGPIVVADNTRVAPVYVPTLEELYARLHPVSTYVEKVQPVVTTYVEQGPAVKLINKKAEDSYKNRIIELQNLEKVALTLDWMGNTLNKFFPNLIVGGIVRGLSPYDYISYGNPGIVTTAFALENPEAAEAVNLVFDFAGPGLASKIPGLVTKGARIMTGTPFRIGNSMYRVRPVRNRLYSGVPMPFEIEKYQPGKLKPGDEVVNQFGLKGTFVKDFNFKGKTVPMVKVGDRTFLTFGQLQPNGLPAESKKILKFKKNANESPLLKRKENARTYLNLLNDLGFMEFEPEVWFKNRMFHNPTKSEDWVTTLGIDAVTDEDYINYLSQLPEYLQIAKDLLVNKDSKIFGNLYKNNKNKWIGKFAFGEREVLPDEYIVSLSKNFKNSGFYYDGKHLYSGMSMKNYGNLLDNGGLGEKAVNWNTNNPKYAQGVADAFKESKVVEGMVGKVSPENIDIVKTSLDYPAPLLYDEFGHTAGYLINDFYLRKGTHDLPLIYTTGGIPEYWRTFGNDTLVKFIRGSNGQFKELHPYRSVLIPTATAGLTYGITKD